MNKQKSEVAQLLQQINLEYEAATRGLTGLSAGSAKPSFITARLEQIGAYHEQLSSLVGEVQQHSLLSNSLSRDLKKARCVDVYWLAQVHPCNNLLFRDSHGIIALVREDISPPLQAFDSSRPHSSLADRTTSLVA